jgi:hypothetical protein|tara:strand:+ start:1880 stop:2503 length:624 start_codon:yes stop_codon:yes gene_type:complete
MSSLNVNTIGEYTSGNGVTIDGALIKDGKVTGGAAGLTLVTSGSVSAVTGITLDNVFTSTFPNYLFQFNGEGTTNNIEELRLRLRASSSTNSDSDSSFVAMLSHKVTGSSSGTGIESDIDASYFQLTGAWMDDEKITAQVTFLEPQVSGQSTSIQYQIGSEYNQGNEGYATHTGTGIKEGTGSFDGLYFYFDGSQTMTGNYRLYGYN